MGSYRFSKSDTIQSKRFISEIIFRRTVMELSSCLSEFRNPVSFRRPILSDRNLLPVISTTSDDFFWDPVVSDNFPMGSDRVRQLELWFWAGTQIIEMGRYEYTPLLKTMTIKSRFHICQQNQQFPLNCSQTPLSEHIPALNIERFVWSLHQRKPLHSELKTDRIFPDS